MSAVPLPEESPAAAVHGEQRLRAIASDHRQSDPEHQRKDDDGEHLAADPRDFREADRAFHAAISQACRNPLLVEVYGKVMARLFRSPGLESLLSDDLTSIATALAHGLRHYRAGRVSEALWWWQFSYVNNWGNLAGAAVSLTLIARTLQYGPPPSLVSKMLSNVLVDVSYALLDPRVRTR